MRQSRARGGRLPRTLPRDELEKRLDAMIRRQGEAAVNRLRDDARLIAPQLGYEAEAEHLALFGPAERNIADAQDLAAGQITWLRAIDNGGPFARSTQKKPLSSYVEHQLRGFFRIECHDRDAATFKCPPLVDIAFVCYLSCVQRWGIG